VILHGEVTGEGGALPVVLLHGLLGQARNLGVAARGLAAAGHRVVSLDLRNHGGSPHDSAMDYPAMAEDVRQTLAARLPGAAEWAVVGHSMGGKVAMMLALRHPELVARLVVADIAPVAYTHSFADYLAAMAKVPLREGLTRAAAEAAIKPLVPDAGVRLFLLQNLRLGGVPYWRCDLTAITANMPAILGWPEVDGAYGGKALFLRGGRSDYVLDDYRPAIRRWFPAAHVAALKGAGHWLHADNPEGFLAAVAGFTR
jgi:pimeloyl-ACP methyl ester carboxylesterase